MLVVQAVTFSLATVPLYAAARGIGCTAWQAFCDQTRPPAESGHRPGQSHLTSMSRRLCPLLAFTALWSLVKGTRAPCSSLSTLAILTLKEDGALLALAMCWVAWFAFGQRGFVVVAAVAAVGYMVLATYVIIPYFRGDDLDPFIERYGYLGASPGPFLWASLGIRMVVFSPRLVQRPWAASALFSLRWAAPVRRPAAIAGAWYRPATSPVVSAAGAERPRSALPRRAFDCRNPVGLVAVRDRALSTGTCVASGPRLLSPARPSSRPGIAAAAIVWLRTGAV